MDDELRQQMRRRVIQALQREAELRALVDVGGTTACENCGTVIPADQALSNGGWCDACSYGEGGDDE